MLKGICKSLKDAMRLLQRDPDITAASTVDDGELAEELRKDAMSRKNEAMKGGPGPQGPGPQGRQPA